MKELAGVCAACPWRNDRCCPTPMPQDGPTHPLNIRMDLAGEGFLVCACYGHPSYAEPRERRQPTDQLPWGSLPYLEASPRGTLEFGREEWSTLQGLLRRPMEGLAAVGLGLFPPTLQEILLTALEDHRSIGLKVNVDTSWRSPDRMALLALRALAHQTGARLEIQEEPVARGTGDGMTEPSVAGATDLFSLTPPGPSVGEDPRLLLRLLGLR